MTEKPINLSKPAAAAVVIAAFTWGGLVCGTAAFLGANAKLKPRADLELCINIITAEKFVHDVNKVKFRSPIGAGGRYMISTAEDGWERIIPYSSLQYWRCRKALPPAELRR